MTEHTLEEKYEAAYMQSAYDETGLNGDAINWRYWVHQMPAISAAQAACLMSALEPDLFASLSGKPGMNDPAPNIEKARKIQRLAEAEGKLTASPTEWVEWARAHRINVHTGFLLAVWELPEVTQAIQAAMIAPTAEQVETKAAVAEKVRPNTKTWDDVKLRALWEESLLPGVKNTILAKKYGVSRQRIGALIGQAKGKFSSTKKNTYSSLLVHKWGNET